MTASPCPVIALGGITARNAPSAIAAGAAGVAAITTVFMDGKDARMRLLDAVHRTR